MNSIKIEKTYSAAGVESGQRVNLKNPKNGHPLLWGKPATCLIYRSVARSERRPAIGGMPWRTSRQRAPLAFCIGRTKRPIGRRTMRAIGLVLLSIAIMALLLTDADATRRSSAQGSQTAGAGRSWCAVHPRHGGENCGYTSFDYAGRR